MKARQYINMVGMAAAVLLSSCVKDTLYDTPHPDYGKIAVTADWSACGEGIDIPTTWTVTMGDYTGTETSATHAPDHLFAPGSYTLAVWNPTEGITVNGTTATIAAATGTRAGTDTFVNNAPGWFLHLYGTGDHRERQGLSADRRNEAAGTRTDAHHQTDG